MRSREVPCWWGSALAHGYPTEDADAKECVSHHRQRVEHCPPVRPVSFEPFQSKASSGPRSTGKDVQDMTDTVTLNIIHTVSSMTISFILKTDKCLVWLSLR